MRIDWDDDSIGANIRVFRELRSRARDQRPAWAAVGRELKRNVELQFDTQGVYLSGKRWKPLDPPYARKKKAAGFATGILVRTGTLRKSFRTMRISKNSIIFGSRLDRAAWHHKGKGNNPRRQILPDERRATRDINRILSDYIRNGVV